MRAVVLVLAACGGFPDFAPSDAGGRAIDPRLGVELARSAHAFRFASAYEAEGPFVVWEEVGVGWNARLGSTILPAPPLDAGAIVLLGRSASIATVRGPDVLVTLGPSWTALPPPPIDATGMFPSQLLVHDGRTYLVIGDHLFVDDGAAWSEPFASGVVGLGGYDATTQWVYASGAWVALGGGVTVSAPAPSGSAINGDATGFQYDAGGVMQTFDGVAVTAHDPDGGGTPWSAPGSHRVIVSQDGSPASTFTFFDDGVAAGTALAPFTPDLRCGCNDSVDFVELRPAPDASAIAMVSAGSIDGDAVLALRTLPLPFAGDPFE